MKSFTGKFTLLGTVDGVYDQVLKMRTGFCRESCASIVNIDFGLAAVAVAHTKDDVVLA